MFPGALPLRLSLTGSLLSCRRIVTLSSSRTPAATMAMSANSAPPRKLAITMPATSTTSRATSGLQAAVGGTHSADLLHLGRAMRRLRRYLRRGEPPLPLAPTTLLHVITILAWPDMGKVGM